MDNDNIYNLQAEYDALHAIYPVGEQCPLIGITANFNDERNAALAEGYFRSVLAAGCAPVIIPPYASREALVETLSRVSTALCYRVEPILTRAIWARNPTTISCTPLTPRATSTN